MLEMRRRLELALQPQLLEVIDEGHMHVGHAGARDGRGHFRVHIVSAQFAGRTGVQRHRLVYQAVGDLMQSDLHALAIEALAPEEA
ncbi:MAG TPA: BolA family protein [Xanthomonadales bacterium]|nr:BolA family protein [Xanthomonadales bacterium]